MTNERGRFFKPIEEISDKFVYLKDKDLMGFDSANIYTFHFFYLTCHNLVFLIFYCNG